MKILGTLTVDTPNALDKVTDLNADLLDGKSSEQYLSRGLSDFNYEANYERTAGDNNTIDTSIILGRYTQLDSTTNKVANSSLILKTGGLKNDTVSSNPSTLTLYKNGDSPSGNTIILGSAGIVNTSGALILNNDSSGDFLIKQGATNEVRLRIAEKVTYLGNFTNTSIVGSTATYVDKFDTALVVGTPTTAATSPAVFIGRFNRTVGENTTSEASVAGIDYKGNVLTGLSIIGKSIVFRTDDTGDVSDTTISDRMVISSTGLIGIGLANPTTMLQIKPNTNIDLIKFTDAAGTKTLFHVDSVGRIGINTVSNATAQLYITGTSAAVGDNTRFGIYNDLIHNIAAPTSAIYGSQIKVTANFTSTTTLNAAYGLYVAPITVTGTGAGTLYAKYGIYQAGANDTNVFMGATTFSNAFTVSCVSSAINIGYLQTSGVLTLGGLSQSGTITLGRSTVTHTLNIDAGATTSGNTKYINIGTGGVTGSTTAITYGSTIDTTHTFNGGVLRIGEKTIFSKLFPFNQSGVSTTYYELFRVGTATNSETSGRFTVAIRTGANYIVSASYEWTSNYTSTGIVSLTQTSATTFGGSSYKIAVDCAVNGSVIFSVNFPLQPYQAVYDVILSGESYLGVFTLSDLTALNTVPADYTRLIDRAFLPGYSTVGNAGAFLDKLLVGKTTDDGNKLQVDGGDATIYGLTVGRGTGAVATNTAVGGRALAANTTGSLNTALGYYAMVSNTTGNSNTALGYYALSANLDGYANVAIGRGALTANTSGYQNIAIGSQDEISVYAPLRSNLSGAANIAVGNGALQANTSGNYNVVVGHQALYSNTTASRNTAVGYQAAYSSMYAINSTYLGYQSGYTGVVGNSNATYIGAYAGYTANSGITGYGENTFVGFRAGYGVTTGVKNTFIGIGANGTNGSGSAITTGNNNTIIGAYTGNLNGLDIRTANNYIVLSDGDGNPRLVINPSGNVGIGTTSTTPTEKLHVVGNVLATGTVSGSNISNSYVWVFAITSPALTAYNTSDAYNASNNYVKPRTGDTVGSAFTDSATLPSFYNKNVVVYRSTTTSSYSAYEQVFPDITITTGGVCTISFAVAQTVGYVFRVIFS